MSFRVKSQKQKQIEYLQQQLQQHQHQLDDFIESSKEKQLSEDEFAQKQRELVDLLTAIVQIEEETASTDKLEEGSLPKKKEEMESFMYYIITLYLYSDDDVYEWLSSFQLDLLPHTNPTEATTLKQRLIQSMDTGEGKTFKLEGMIALSIIGHRNLLHFLADFSFYKTFNFLIMKMQIEETIDDAGLYPHDLIKNEGCKMSLSSLIEEIGEEDRSEEKKMILEFQGRMLSLKRDHITVRDMVHRYNQESREKEKQRLQKLYTDSITGDKVPEAIQLADQCVQSGQCPFQMNYLPSLKPKPVTPLTTEPTVLPPSAPSMPSVEVVVPNQIIVIRNYFTVEQCQDWMKDVQKVYEEGKYEAPNSLNRQGFQTKTTSMDLQVHSLVYSIAKEYEGSLGYDQTKTTYEAYHSFVITYDQSNLKDGSASLPKHVDSSLWTANLCLEAVEAENSVKFWLKKNDPNEKTKAVRNENENVYEEDENITQSQIPFDLSVTLQTGDLLIHHGSIYHATSGPLNTVEGRRTNIVIWYKSAV